MQGLQLRWTGQPEELAELWTLQKGRKHARCIIATHPVGWELRLVLAGELMRSQVHRNEADLIAEGHSWRVAMFEKGWQPPPLSSTVDRTDST